MSYKQIRELRNKYVNNEVLHLNKASIVKKCEYCGKLYTPIHHSQKYCDKTCSKNALQEQKNEWKREKWLPRQKLGTSYINEKRKKDFDDEHKQLKAELYRLGLKKRR